MTECALSVALQLLEALDWCLGLGITCVSVYAFSIENFRREAREVELLMRLAEQKLDQLLQARPEPATQGLTPLYPEMKL